jgi:hypothetical protein
MILKTWGATIYENLLACTPSSRSQISTVVSSTLAGKETPALLNRMSSRLCAAITASLRPVLFRCHVEMRVARVVALGAQGSRGALAQVVADVGSALPSRTNRCAAAQPHQLALDRSRRAGQQRYFALAPHFLFAAPRLIGGRMRHFAVCLHRRAALEVRRCSRSGTVSEWCWNSEVGGKRPVCFRVSAQRQ